MPDTASTTLLAVLTGVLATLGPAWLTHHFSVERERDKSERDEREKEQERKFGLKKSIYLDVVSDFARFQVALGKLADTPILELQREFNGTEWAASFARLEIVASLPVYRAAQQAGLFIQEQFPPLVTERVALQIEWDQLQDPTLSATLEERCRWEELRDRFRLKCMGTGLDIRRRLVPLYREMRREIDTAVEMKQVEQLLEESLQAASLAIDKMTADLTRRFGARASAR